MCAERTVPLTRSGTQCVKRTVPLTHSQTLDDAAVDTGQALNLAAGEAVLLQKNETFVPFGTVHGLNARAAVQVEFLPDQADSLAIRQSGPLGDVQAFRFFPALAEPEKAIQTYSCQLLQG